MITIEGSSGKGSLWCVFRTPGSGTPNPVSGVNLTTGANVGIRSITPFECYLPPVTGTNVWYPVPGSPYGPRLSKMEVGTLFGVRNSPDTPNPCEHSTITGSVVLGSTDPTKQIGWLTVSSRLNADGVPWYLPGKALALFANGYPISNAYVGQPQIAYNRYGELKAFTNTSNNADVWKPMALLTDWCGSADPSNPGSRGPKRDQVLSSYPFAPGENPVGLTLTKSHTDHVSANVWKEVRVETYHHNTSYVPSLPLSPDTGVGFVVSSQKRTRTLTMTAICSENATSFLAQFMMVEVLEVWGHDPAYPVARYVAETKEKTTSFTTCIRVMKPGLSSGNKLLKDSFDRFCGLAKIRAASLYESKSATIARSNAVADVSALDSNWLENLSQVGGTADVILPLILGWKAVKHGNIMEAKRALAGAYLAYMYVVAPAISDYHDVKDNIGTLFKGFTTNRFSNERRRGSHKLVTSVCETSANLAYNCTLNLQLKDNSYAAIFNALERLGLDPSAGNIWDLIPFSFVVDWFLNIGNDLKRADAASNNVAVRDCKNRIESFKVQWPITALQMKELDLAGSTVVSPLIYSWYDRRILSGFGSFDPLAGQSNDGLSVSQMTQGAALLSSYRR